MKAWGITDGSAGMVAQVRALAETCGFALEEKTISLYAPWSWLPATLYTKPFLHFLLPGNVRGDAPDVVISCGKRGNRIALLLKQKMRNTKYICIQDPRISPKHFDLVVAMEHDRISGANVIKTRFALHSVVPEKLFAAETHWRERFAMYPRPYISVLFGGSTNKYTLTLERMETAIKGLEALMSARSASLLITPSRRTGRENIAILKAHFAGNPRVYIYNEVNENPYMGLLALADEIVVTNDSVNMMSEAYVTGKPLHILRLCGHAHTKPARFAEKLVAEGAANWASERNAKAHTPVNEMVAIADEVRRMLSGATA